MGRVDVRCGACGAVPQGAPFTQSPNGTDRGVTE